MASADYRQASYDVWQRMAEGWGRERLWTWDASRRVGEWMVEALDLQPGETILELAAGPGETGFAAAQLLGDEGRFICTDFAPNMVEVARSESQRLGLGNVEHRQLDAERMDLEDSSVDGVLCRWGYMLMADPAAALRETRRVLRDGGLLAVSVWGTAEANPWASIPGRVLREQTGAPPPDPTAPGIFALADPERTRSLLEAAGFDVKRMEDVAMTWRFEDFEAYWTFLVELAGAIAVAIAALSDEDQRELRGRLEPAIEPYRANGGYEFPG
ncbi:MAG: methyltransferase domain-containing protein, partial [Dehalococcoidia bacterium]